MLQSIYWSLPWWSCLCKRYSEYDACRDYGSATAQIAMMSRYGTEMEKADIVVRLVQQQRLQLVYLVRLFHQV